MYFWNLFLYNFVHFYFPFFVHSYFIINKHSDICGDFKQKYGSVKVFEKKFYADLTKEIVNIKIIQIKIQIHFNKSTLTYVDYTK